MSIASRPPGSLASHAVCVAAGARDSLRTAQFFARMLSGAEGWGRAPEDNRPLSGKGRAEAAAPPREFILTAIVSRLARLADRVMTWSVNTAIALFVPDWRKLPSPFTYGMMNDVAQAIRADSFLVNPIFNTYFYRASIHILRRYRTPPFLVLEYRVDAARRRLMAECGPGLYGAETEFLARAIITLAEAAPIAREGRPKDVSIIAQNPAQNVAVYAIACIALLFAEQGRPAEELDEDQFFAVVGALIGPRLGAIEALIAARDVPGLAAEFADIRAMY